MPTAYRRASSCVTATEVVAAGVDTGDVVAGGGERLRHRATNAAGRPGHEDMAAHVSALPFVSGIVA